jgi:hypothetical protein
MNEIPPSRPGFWQRAMNARIPPRLSASVLFAVPSAWILWLMIGHRDFQKIVWLLGGPFLGLACFFFAAVWRHGFRWLFSRRALRFHAAWAASLLTFVVFFYTEENWRGKWAWAALQREASARGESLDFKSLAPPAVPDEQSFAKAPGVAALLGLTNQPNFSFPFDHGQASQGPSASWLRQQSTDLAKWQKFFRARGENSVAAKGGATTLTFPVTPEPQTPAADVLFALGKFATNLATLGAASQRPLMRLPLDYGKGFFLAEDLTRPLQSLWSAVHLLSLRASAELAQGQGEAALQDVVLALRLTKSTFDYEYGHRSGMMRFCLQPIWEGLTSHRWNDEQLAALQKELAALDLLADYRLDVRGETLRMMWLFGQIQALCEGQPSELSKRGSTDSNDRFWTWVVKTFYPVGWLYQDKVWIYRFYQRHADPLDAAALRNQALDARAAERRTMTDPIAAGVVLPRLRQVFSESAPEALMLQTFLQQARTACALERFHAAQGQYPAALEALRPKYLQQVPDDILAGPGQKLKYVPTPGGGFKLYSIGFNRIDDGVVWLQPGQN